MANTYLTDDVITLEALSVLENNLVAAKHFERKYEGLFGQHGNTSNRSDTIRIRKPNRYTIRNGRVFAAQDVVDEFVSFSIDTQIGVDLFIYSDELTQKLSSFSDQVIKPNVALIANAIDVAILDAARQSFNAVGTPGSPANTLATYLSAGVKLDQNACPRDGQRAAILGPQSQADIVDALKGLTESSKRVSGQYESGEMTKAAGLNWEMDQNVGMHTVGPFGGSPVVNGASQVGASLITNGWTASAAPRVKKNDVFTVPNVFSVNPVSKVSTGVLQQFRVTADGSSDGSGNLTIAIEPSIVTSGAQQTVTASPTNGNALTFLGAANTVGANNIVAHKQALVYGFAELPKPDGTDMSSTKTDKQLGLSIRFVRWYDGDQDRFKARFDVKYGVKVLRPEWICRVAAAAA